MVALSGGKDSTAMLLMLLERGIDPGHVVFYETGWEFPQVIEHIEKLEDYTGVKIIRLRGEKSYDYYFAEYGGQGYGFPTYRTKWCERIKFQDMTAFQEKVGDKIRYVGIAYNERKRAEKMGKVKAYKDTGHKYPLVEWKVTEEDALKYCKKHGFTWGGLYDHFDRLSCFCCPFKNLSELRNLWKYYPDLWEKLKKMEEKSKNKFRADASVFDLEKRFEAEQKQLCLF